MNRKILYTDEPLTVHEDIQLLTVETRVPNKYVLIDTETGQVYRGSSEKRWKKLSVNANLLKLFIKHIFARPDQEETLWQETLAMHSEFKELFKDVVPRSERK